MVVYLSWIGRELYASGEKLRDRRYLRLSGKQSRSYRQQASDMVDVPFRCRNQGCNEEQSRTTSLEFGHLVAHPVGKDLPSIKRLISNVCILT